MRPDADGGMHKSGIVHDAVFDFDSSIVMDHVVAWQPGGERAATIDIEGAIRLWSLAENQPELLRRWPGEAKALSFSGSSCGGGKWTCWMARASGINPRSRSR